MARSSGLVRLVNRFGVIESAPVSLAKPREASDLMALPEALLAWGAPSDFLIPTGQQVGAIQTVNIPPGDFVSKNFDSILRDFEEAVDNYENGEGGNETTEEGDPPPARVYNEVLRTVSVVRVTNPSDAEQYVDVERIETIVFRGPDGLDVKFVLNHEGA